jgi:predicted chitinase
MDFILSVWENAYEERVSLPQLAYALATTYHETATKMQPIRELGGRAYLTDNYDIGGRNPRRAKLMGNTAAGDGARYCGRGFVQLTWKVNYIKAGKKLAIDLVNQPDLALNPINAAIILFEGMEEGWFTGKTNDGAIDDEIDGNEHRQFVYARKIINGTDKAELIARIAGAFLVAIQSATTP